MSEIELRKLFDFMEADLIANRMGRITPRQEKILKQAASIGRIISLFIAIPILLWGVYFPVRGIVHDYSDYGFSGSLIGAGVFALVMLTIAMFMIGGVFKKDVISVIKAEGNVNFVAVEKQVTHNTSSSTNKIRTVRQYELRVGAEKFEDVNESLLSLINEGDDYAFYFVPSTRHILSCELIKKGK